MRPADLPIGPTLFEVLKCSVMVIPDMWSIDAVAHGVHVTLLDATCIQVLGYADDSVLVATTVDAYMGATQERSEGMYVCKHPNALKLLALPSSVTLCSRHSSPP